MSPRINNARSTTKQGVIEVKQFNDVTEIYFRWGSKSDKGIPYFTIFTPNWHLHIAFSMEL